LMTTTTVQQTQQQVHSHQEITGRHGEAARRLRHVTETTAALQRSVDY